MFVHWHFKCFISRYILYMHCLLSYLHGDFGAYTYYTGLCMLFWCADFSSFRSYFKCAFGRFFFPSSSTFISSSTTTSHVNSQSDSYSYRKIFVFNNSSWILLFRLVSFRVNETAILIFDSSFYYGLFFSQRFLSHNPPVSIYALCSLAIFVQNKKRV